MIIKLRELRALVKQNVLQLDEAAGRRKQITTPYHFLLEFVYYANSADMAFSFLDDSENLQAFYKDVAKPVMNYYGSLRRIGTGNFGIVFQADDGMLVKIGLDRTFGEDLKAYKKMAARHEAGNATEHTLFVNFASHLATFGRDMHVYIVEMEDLRQGDSSKISDEQADIVRENQFKDWANYVVKLFGRDAFTLPKSEFINMVFQRRNEIQAGHAVSRWPATKLKNAIGMVWDVLQSRDSTDVDLDLHAGNFRRHPRTKAFVAFDT